MALSLVEDALWAVIASLLPSPRKKRGHRHGRHRVADRAVFTGIVYVLRSGIPWQMLPREMGCGAGSTCERRLVRWQCAGVQDDVRRWDRSTVRASGHPKIN